MDGIKFDKKLLEFWILIDAFFWNISGAVAREMWEVEKGALKCSDMGYGYAAACEIQIALLLLIMMYLRKGKVGVDFRYSI